MFSLSAELTSPYHFNLYSAYGHKTYGGAVSINSDMCVSIEFGEKTKNYQNLMLSTFN